MKNISTFLIISISVLLACEKQRIYTENDIQIIPKPISISLTPGSFKFSKATTFVVTNDSEKQISEILINKFEKAAGWKPIIADKVGNSNNVMFKIDSTLTNEAYRIEVNNNIVIAAKNNAGLLYGIESIRQLLPNDIESLEIVKNVSWEIPKIKIEDKPRFPYRGFMLDVSRHFFNAAYLKELIDNLSFLKMNVLHLHLVDDQGWRIEIKKYPKLTEIGAWRVDQEDLDFNARKPNTPGEKGTYGGFFTQEELKSLVAYAQSKNVEIIPEIEMPAHVTSAVASYPNLACFDKEVAVPSGGVWPITDIYCAGKDTTFEFLQDVLDEVMTIFPSKYIHIGGDEATKTNWEKCTHCQNRIKTEGLKNVDELQSYFIKRIETYLNSKGKKLIGWDEIIEGGLAPEATVMSWRGTIGGVKATMQGNDAIMTPGTHCYFDHYQGPQNDEPKAWGGFNTLSNVYTFDPIVDTMTTDQIKHVLGGQANLWTEHVPTPDHANYMIFPRLFAMSEVLWTPKSDLDWSDFSNRVKNMFKRFDIMKINYAKSAYLVTAISQIDLENKEVSIALQNEFLGSDIRYFIGNVPLNETAMKYTEPIKLKETTILKASVFENNKPVGKTFIDTIRFHKGTAKKVNYITQNSENYKGQGDVTLVNTLRGTKNFHDGQWQAWIDIPMEVVVDLDEITPISQVSIGSMESQGPGIYFPTHITVWLSKDGENYTEVGTINRPFEKSSSIVLKEFKIAFNTQDARYVKVKAESDLWLFVDEIIIE